jgi:hypothetical protein
VTGLPWQERADAIHKRRLARGASVGQPDADDPSTKDDADLPETNNAFDYMADVAAFPFRWSPADDWSLYKEQSSQYDLETCVAPGCDRAVRKLKPSSMARPLYCSLCLEPNSADRNLELEWVKVNGRYVQMGMSAGDVWRVASHPADRQKARRVLALSLPEGRSEIEPVRKSPTRPRGRDYSINEKREVIFLYRNMSSLSMADIAERAGVPAATVRQWVKRHAADEYFQRPPTNRQKQSSLPNLPRTKRHVRDVTLPSRSGVLHEGSSRPHRR